MCYRLVLLDGEGMPADTFRLEYRVDDLDAIKAAHRMLAENDVEVWRGKRPICVLHGHRSLKN